MWYPLYNFNYIHHLLYIINCTWSIHKWSEASSIGFKTYQFLINFNMYFLIPLTSGISEIIFSLHQKVNRWIFSVGGYRKCKFELIFFLRSFARDLCPMKLYLCVWFLWKIKSFEPLKTEWTFTSTTTKRKGASGSLA